MDLLQVSIAVDQLANTLFAGMADETLSARAYRQSLAGPNPVRWAYFRRIIDGIFFWQHRHCYEAFRSELNRKQLPEEYSGHTDR